MQWIASLLTCSIFALSVSGVYFDSTYENSSPRMDSKLNLAKMFLFAANPALGGRPLSSKHARTPTTRMQSVAVDDIMTKLKSLTLLEASELVGQIEEVFGVDASAPAGGMMMAAPAAGAGGGAAEEAVEKTEFDLILDSFGDKKIQVIKVVREISGLGLKEAKEKVESAPAPLLEGQPKATVEEAIKKIEDAGGKASMK